MPKMKVSGCVLFLFFFFRWFLLRRPAQVNLANFSHGQALGLLQGDHIFAQSRTRTFHVQRLHFLPRPGKRTGRVLVELQDTHAVIQAFVGELVEELVHILATGHNFVVLLFVEFSGLRSWNVVSNVVVPEVWNPKRGVEGNGVRGPGRQATPFVVLGRSTRHGFCNLHPDFPVRGRTLESDVTVLHAVFCEVCGERVQVLADVRECLPVLDMRGFFGVRKGVGLSNSVGKLYPVHAVVMPKHTNVQRGF
jgi:hypothetical protein